MELANETGRHEHINHLPNEDLTLVMENLNYQDIMQCRKVIPSRADYTTGECELK